jgi:hypothetical protein
MNPKESTSPPSRVSSDSDYHNEHETFFGLENKAKNRNISHYVTIFLVLALLSSNAAWLWYIKHTSWPSSQHDDTQCKCLVRWSDLFAHAK